ncbi:mitochondrial import inner membrane translocase subunit Tim29-like [Ornithodoros turicata]
MSVVRHFSRISNSVGRIAEKYKGGRLEKFSLYWKSLGEDYNAAVKDIIDDAKKRPMKAAFLMSGLALLGYAVKSNPNEHSFMNQVATASNDLLLLSDNNRNPKSDTHIRHLEWCINKKLLRTSNLIVATVIWEADYDSECDTFAAHCSYLQPRYLTFHERVLDIGIMGFWLNLMSKMRDFDVNQSEWEGK